MANIRYHTSGSVFGAEKFFPVGDLKCGTDSLVVEWPPNFKQLCVLTNLHALPTAAIADKAQVVLHWQNAEGASS